jgi:hypothetical protein
MCRQSDNVQGTVFKNFRHYDAAAYRQFGCSQPQEISITPESSAFSQYSLQYLLSARALHPQTPWAHLSFSAIPLPAFSINATIISVFHTRLNYGRGGAGGTRGNKCVATMRHVTA